MNSGVDDEDHIFHLSIVVFESAIDEKYQRKIYQVTEEFYDALINHGQKISK
jgi:hypothetical protein